MAVLTLKFDLHLSEELLVKFLKFCTNFHENLTCIFREMTVSVTNQPTNQQVIIIIIICIISAFRVRCFPQWGLVYNYFMSTFSAPPNVTLIILKSSQYFVINVSACMMGESNDESGSCQLGNLSVSSSQMC